MGGFKKTCNCNRCHNLAHLTLSNRFVWSIVVIAFRRRKPLHDKVQYWILFHSSPEWSSKSTSNCSYTKEYSIVRCGKWPNINSGLQSSEWRLLIVCWPHTKTRLRKFMSTIQSKEEGVQTKARPPRTIPQFKLDAHNPPIQHLFSCSFRWDLPFPSRCKPTATCWLFTNSKS